MSNQLNEFCKSVDQQVVLQDDRGTAFRKYIERLQCHYWRWYARSKQRNQRLWYVIQAVALLASFGTTAVAALFSPDELKASPAAHTALVILPLIASLAAAALAQMRPRELMLLRDAGREAVESVIEFANAHYPAVAGDAQRLTELHLQLVERISEIERSQLTEFAKTTRPKPDERDVTR